MKKEKGQMYPKKYRAAKTMVNLRLPISFFCSVSKVWKKPRKAPWTPWVAVDYHDCCVHSMQTLQMVKWNKVTTGSSLPPFTMLIMGWFFPFLLAKTRYFPALIRGNGGYLVQVSQILLAGIEDLLKLEWQWLRVILRDKSGSKAT